MWKKIAGFSLLTVASVSGAGIAYLYFRDPASQPAPNVRVAMDQERVARGKYLYALADCDGCHSPHDTSRLYLPVNEAKRGSGQAIPDDGTIHYIPNITPDPETGIGAWTDGEKIRAIREGIGRDGRALVPFMPYGSYRHMSDDDVQSLVAYLNTLAPVKQKQPRMEAPLPFSLLVKSMPQPVTKPVVTPPRDNTVLYGEYLATIGNCAICHTQFGTLGPDSSKRFAGGHEFKFPGATVVSANITPDPDTGIGRWSREYFLDRFRRHRGVQAESLPAATPELFTVMPWRNLSQMTDGDLSAIYDYLMTRPAIANRVATHPVTVAQR
jgi:mono/diheme cytochrome c family protein